MTSVRSGMKAVGAALCAAVLLASIGPAVAAETQQRARTFASAEEAAKALVAAVGDRSAVLAILGPDAQALIDSGDATADKLARERFLKAHAEASRLQKSGDDMALLIVGKDEWIFPIPIVKDAAGWRFDTKEGREEILNRRIGRNELSAVQAVLAYADAQREYYLRNPQGDKLLHYAQKFVSAPGKRDGLYFATKAGEKPSPLGPLFASAKAEGYKKGEAGQPYAYHGYHYRILRAQGPSARGGAYDYVAQGRMIGGFALVAWPASYGNSGVMTFIVNHDGIVFEKDLGPNTASAVKKITRFNPDKSWKRN